METQSKTTPLDEAVVIRKLSLVSVLGNAVLSGFKLFAGVTGHSSAMISDAVHSFSDVLTTLIAWVGVKISKKDSDEEHPYGHERLECIASLLLGIVLLLTGLGIGKAGLQTIVSGDYQTLTVPAPIALAVAIISIVGKEAMYWYTRHYALLINSSAFLASPVGRLLLHRFPHRHRRRHAGVPGTGLGGQRHYLPVHPQSIL